MSAPFSYLHQPRRRMATLGRLLRSLCRTVRKPAHCGEFGAERPKFGEITGRIDLNASGSARFARRSVATGKSYRRSFRGVRRLHPPTSRIFQRRHHGIVFGIATKTLQSRVIRRWPWPKAAMFHTARGILRFGTPRAKDSHGEKKAVHLPLRTKAPRTDAGTWDSTGHEARAVSDRRSPQRHSTRNGSPPRGMRRGEHRASARSTAVAVDKGHERVGT